MSGDRKRYFLGIDGGGTSTEACLVAFLDNISKDSSLPGGSGVRESASVPPFEVVSTGTGGPSNLYAVSPGVVFASVKKAIATCFSLPSSAAPGVPVPGLGAVEASCLAMAGAATSEDKERLAEMLRPVFPPGSRLFVVEDTLAALAASHEGMDGIVLIAGTGSNCLGMKGGKVAKSGGWGYLFGDEGSAYDIVRRALKAAFRARDGRGENTAITQVVYSWLSERGGGHTPRRRELHEDGCEDRTGTGSSVPGRTSSGNAPLEDFLPVLYRMSRDELASLAPLVMKAAEEGDEVAGSVLRCCAQDLVEMVVSVATKLETDTPAVSFVGGTLRVPVYANLVREGLRVAIPGATLKKPRYSPSVGAAIVAYMLSRSEFRRE